MRTLIQGVGGIGGVVAATLLNAGFTDLQLVTGNPQLAEAITRDGLRFRERDGSTKVARPTLPASPTVPEGGGPYELIILVTQTPRLAEALQASRAQLSPSGVVLCLQNGLPEAHAEAIVGQGRVLGGVVGWAASMTAPGEYVRTTPGAIHLGWPGRPADAQAKAIAAALAPTATCTSPTTCSACAGQSWRSTPRSRRWAPSLGCRWAASCKTSPPATSPCRSSARP
jgi:ketopantoate reductase